MRPARPVPSPKMWVAQASPLNSNCTLSIARHELPRACLSAHTCVTQLPRSLVCHSILALAQALKTSFPHCSWGWVALLQLRDAQRSYKRSEVIYCSGALPRSRVEEEVCLLGHFTTIAAWWLACGYQPTPLCFLLGFHGSYMSLCLLPLVGAC